MISNKSDDRCRKGVRPARHAAVDEYQQLDPLQTVGGCTLFCHVAATDDCSVRARHLGRVERAGFVDRGSDAAGPGAGGARVRAAVRFTGDLVQESELPLLWRLSHIH